MDLADAATVSRFEACFKAWFWDMVLGSRRPSLMAIQPLPPSHQLDNVLRQLTSLRSVWHCISPSRRIQSLNIAADGLDDLVEQLDAGLAPAPGFTKTEQALLGLFAAAFLVGASVLVGFHLGQHSCPAPNVARVGP